MRQNVTKLRTFCPKHGHPTYRYYTSEYIDTSANEGNSFQNHIR